MLLPLLSADSLSTKQPFALLSFPADRVDSEAVMSSAAQFFRVIQARDTAAVKRMLAAEPELASARNEKGQSALLLTVYGGNKELCDTLLAQGVPLELHESAALGQLERVKQLVEKEPRQAESYSPDGFPVIALTAVFGHLEVAEYLFAKGADVNAVATNGTGYNALTGAVASGHTAMVAWLLENGADPKYRYGAGYSPLLTAAANGHLGIVSMLLGNGADLSARTNDGKTALKFAEERGHPEVAEFLRSRGAA
jgi:ankyrin repeat protein